MSAVSAPTGPAPAGEASGQFFGSTREYWRILSRDALALIATLGLYRFWVSTDVRRYLWSHTNLAGERLDYTGDPLELLVGFLVLLLGWRREWLMGALALLIVLHLAFNHGGLFTRVAGKSWLGSPALELLAALARGIDEIGRYVSLRDALGSLAAVTMAAMRDSAISGSGMVSLARASATDKSASWSRTQDGMLSASALALR